MFFGVGTITYYLPIQHQAQQGPDTDVPQGN